MTSLSVNECCQIFAIDPKTLRQWLAQVGLSPHPHPRDARVKCLTAEQVQLLARLHSRVLPVPMSGALAGKTERYASSSLNNEADLREKLAQMETQLATLQAQVTDLALQLLKEQPLRLSLEAQVMAHGDRALVPRASAAPGTPSEPERSLLVRHPTEQRTPLVPLIEYGARGQYVLICPKQGELPIIPDSPEWFAWLASLPSFRFVGRSGRFSARRGYNRRPNRCWYAQRRMHQKNYSKYIGVSERLTTERLEQVAASFQAYLP